MKLILRVSFLYIMFLNLSAAAETNNPPIQQDYGAGFAKFRALGLPNAAGGKYVHLTTYSRTIYSQDSGGVFNGVKGTGWLFESTDTNNLAVRYISKGSEYEYYPLDYLKKENKKRQKAARKKAKASGKPVSSFMHNDNRIGASWKEVDPKKDADLIVKRLIEKQKKHSFRYESKTTGPAVFFAAAHFYSNGYTNEANQILEQLFVTCDDRRSLIINTVNQLANTQYNEVCSNFFKNKDWKKFDQNLLNLLMRFSRGWQFAPAAKRLYTAVHKRVSTATPPAITGDYLTAEDKELARQLASAIQSEDYTRYRYYGAYQQETAGWNDRTLWFLSPPKKDDSSSPGITNAVTGTNVLKIIKQKKMDAIPLLVALVDDDYLTCLPSSSGRSEYRDYSMWSGSSHKMSTELMYMMLRRPLSRGEVAKTYLRTILPAGNDESQNASTESEQDTSSFKTNLIAWYQANKDKPSNELAKMYLSEGNNEQRNSAVKYLIRFGDSNDLKLVEKIFLDPEHFSTYRYNVRCYVEKYGPKAKDFVTQYTNVMSSVSSDNNFKNLVKLVNTKSLFDTLDQVAEGKQKLSDISNILYTLAIKEKDKNAVIRATLKTACKIDNISDKTTLIRIIHYLNNAKIDLESVADTAELWQQLLSDTNALPRDNRTDTSGTIADFTAVTMELLYSDDKEASHKAMYLEGRTKKLIKERAQQRLAGKKLSPLPAADNVSQQDLQKIVDNLISTNNPAALIESLSNDALLALNDPFESNSNLWPRAISSAHRITNVSIDEPLKSLCLTPPTGSAEFLIRK